MIPSATTGLSEGAAPLQGVETTVDLISQKRDEIRKE
jgi:hypothetical protein